MWTPPLVWPPAAKSNHLVKDTFLVIFCLRTILSLILADTSIWNLRVPIFQFCFWRICWAVLCWRDRGRWCGFAGGGGRQGGGGDRRLGFRVVQGGGDHAGEVGSVVVLHRVRRRPRGSAGGTKLWDFSYFTWSLPSRFVPKDLFTICIANTTTRNAITITFFSSSKRRFHFVQSLLKQRPGQQRQSSFPKALVLNSCSHGIFGINGGFIQFFILLRMMMMMLQTYETRCYNKHKSLDSYSS